MRGAQGLFHEGQNPLRDWESLSILALLGELVYRGVESLYFLYGRSSHLYLLERFLAVSIASKTTYPS
jgi:hypothetical protein